MPNINLNLLKYFYYVAKYNSYTKAASELMISQPSLSYSIKVLEDELDKKLFNRGKKLELTNYGKFLYKQVSEMMNIMDNLNISDTVKGKIIIGMRPQFTYKVFPYFFNQLNKIYPDLTIEHISGTKERLKELLYSSQIDILIDEYEYNGDFESFLQMEDEIIVIKDKNDKSILDDELMKKRKIGIVYPNKVTDEIKEMYPDFDYVEFQSTPLMITQMHEDYIVCITPKSVVKDYLDKKEVKIIKTNLKFPKANMYITYNKKLKNKNIDAVVDFFKEYSFYDLNKID